MLDLQYLPLAAASDRLRETPDGVLGMLGFPRLPNETRASLPMANVGAPNTEAASTPICELWLSRGPVQHGSEGRLQHARSGDFLFGVLSLPESEGGIQQRSLRAYREVFAAIDKLGHPHLLRCWNYFPRINEPDDGMERYRLFNLGRHAAFETAGRTRVDDIPAACALGTTADDALTVYFVAARHRGRRIENPRQVNAWQYPPQYGPRSPTFARAMVYPAADPSMLFVSGTASIVGHESLHVGDVVGQTRETVENLKAVFAEANRVAGTQAFDMEEASYKVYVRHAEDTPRIREELLRAWGADADVNYLRADVCRSDLLMEIEAACL